MESIIGLGELTALSGLCLFCSKLHEGVPIGSLRKPRWMCALCTSLEKLDMLRSFMVLSFGEVAYCADALSLLSPPFAGSLERLNLSCWSFSMVPRWIGHLCSLKELSLGVKQIIQEDIAMIGMLPSLIRLRLRIVCAPVTKIVIGEGLFSLVKLFDFDCDGISSLTFEAGAMCNLRHLILAINIDDWDRATPEGLQHLEGLQQIEVCKACRHTRGNREAKAEDVQIKSVFQYTVDLLPSRPLFTYSENEYILRQRLFSILTGGV